MSVKSFLIIALSITMGIGAITHAKTELIKQALQETTEYRELAFRSPRPGRYR